jgi:uncharacterized protein involved in type VI secretion and phage assembly
MSNQHDTRGKKYFGMEVGVVTDNKDPKGIGRVRVRIAGICEPHSAWALPIGGGRGANRGTFCPPLEGAEVSVWFKSGDTDHPYYMKGNHGAATEAETPGPAGGYKNTDDPAKPGTDEAYKVPAWEGEHYVIFVDEREASKRLVIRNKVSDDQIIFDGKRHLIQIKATELLHLKADGAVKIEGASVDINGRVVASLGRPIR